MRVNCFTMEYASTSSLWLMRCGFISPFASVSKFQIRKPQEAAPQPSNQNPLQSEWLPTFQQHGAGLIGRSAGLPCKLLRAGKDPPVRRLPSHQSPAPFPSLTNFRASGEQQPLGIGITLELRVVECCTLELTNPNLDRQQRRRRISAVNLSRWSN